MTVKQNKFPYEMQIWAEMGQSLSDFNEKLLKKYEKFKFIQ